MQITLDFKDQKSDKEYRPMLYTIGKYFLENNQVLSADDSLRLIAELKKMNQDIEQERLCSSDMFYGLINDVKKIITTAYGEKRAYELFDDLKETLSHPPEDEECEDCECSCDKIDIEKLKKSYTDMMDMIINRIKKA